MATKEKPAPNVITSPFVDVELANQWFVSALNLIRRTIGDDSEHYSALKRLFTNYPKFPDVQQAYGVLLAAKADIETGSLFNIRSLIEAEVFDSFLEQASALLQAGYYAPAAVVIGCVLEDCLKSMCELNGISLEEHTQLDRMNAELVKAGAYNKLTQKKVTTLADIRNNAAHGNWKEFTKQDIENMLLWVEEFSEKALG